MIRHTFTAMAVLSAAVCFVLGVAYVFDAPSQAHVFGIPGGWSGIIWPGNFAFCRDRYFVSEPLWIAALPFAILPIAWLVASVRRDRRRRKR